MAEIAALRDALAARADPDGDKALLAELVAAARDGREPVDDTLKHAFGAAGCEVEAFTYNPASVPLVEEFAAPHASVSGPEQVMLARLPGQGGARSLLVFAHPDVEPFETDPRWTADPFCARSAGGRITGWGVADDLAGCATMVRMAALLRARETVPHGDITFVSAPSKAHRRGIAAALAHGLRADAAVYCHPAESGRGLNEIKAFAPGQLEFRINIEGEVPATNEPAHTAFAHTGVNPLNRAKRVIDALGALDHSRGHAVTHPRLETAIGRSTNIMLSHLSFGTGAPLCRMPEGLTLGGAMTLVPGERLADIMREVEGVVQRAAGPGAAPAIEWVSGVSAAETPSDAPLYRVAEAVLESVGAAPKVNPLHTSSDIRNPIVQAGIPTVGFGPLCGDLTMAGGANEWVDARDFSRAILASATLAAAWGA